MACVPHLSFLDVVLVSVMDWIRPFDGGADVAVIVGIVYMSGLHTSLKPLDVSTC